MAPVVHDAGKTGFTQRMSCAPIGAEERRAVAVVVIGGQMLSLVLTLLVTPVVHLVLARIFTRAPSLHGDQLAQTPVP